MTGRFCPAANATRLQWRNRLAHGTYRQYKRYASPGAATLFFYSIPACWPKKRISWQLWDSNPRPFGLVPKTSALDHSAKLPLCSKHCLQENQARSLPCPESNPPVLFIKLEDWCSKSGFASCEVWTHDPWFTRPVLYHWAKEALVAERGRGFWPGLLAVLWGMNKTKAVHRTIQCSLPPERIELSTPGLQDQCSATEL